MYKKNKKRKKIILSVIGILLVVIAAGVVRYLTFFMKADEEAVAAMASIDRVSVEEDDKYITFTPTDNNLATAMVYYPGGQVEPESFAYAARSIAEHGYTFIIAKMPFNLAMFDYNEAKNIVKNHDEIENWYLSGFSLGGVAACMTLSKDETPFKGLVLYASYTTDNYDLKDSSLRVKSISASNDGLATADKIEKGKRYLPENTEYFEIKGGNHTQFAIYGDGEIQKGDNKADIDRMKQQDILVEETLKFMNGN